MKKHVVQKKHTCLCSLVDNQASWPTYTSHQYMHICNTLISANTVYGSSFNIQWDHEMRATQLRKWEDFLKWKTVLILNTSIHLAEVSLSKSCDSYKLNRSFFVGLQVCEWRWLSLSGILGCVINNFPELSLCTKHWNRKWNYLCSIEVEKGHYCSPLPSRDIQHLQEVSISILTYSYSQSWCTMLGLSTQYTIEAHKSCFFLLCW